MAIGAYYPCSKQLTSANEMLEAYRTHYPDTTVVIVNDAGDSKHELLAERFKCKYVYEAEYIGSPESSNEADLISKWISRFLQHIVLIEEDWFVLLKDDVFIIKSIDDKKLQYDINGINSNNLLPQPAVDLIKARGYHKDATSLVYGAMGGTIFRTSFFKGMSKIIPTIENDIKLFSSLCLQQLPGKNWHYSDVVLSFLTYLYGGSLGSYPEFAEMWFKDLGQRILDNRVGCLNQYNFVLGYPSHPRLECLKRNTYTIVLPTRGSGEAYDIFIEKLLPRYAELLVKEDVEEFIVICPESNVEKVAGDLKQNGGGLPFVILKDEQLCSFSGEGWIKQQIIKLAVNVHVKTEHYLIIDDDLIITKSLAFSDFFDENDRIYYSAEPWPVNGPYFATNTSWWSSSLIMHNINPNALVGAKELMGVTPQLMLTRVVNQMIHSFGPDWMSKMAKLRATEYCLYWIYILKTLRSHYYTPSIKFFAMDNSVNILMQGLTEHQIKTKIHKGLNELNYHFIVVQSWMKYPKEWICGALNSAVTVNK